MRKKRKPGRTVWIDVTTPLDAGMTTWPSDPPVTLAPFKKGLSLLSMGTHAGTHIDPPRHIREKGMSVDRIALDAFIGPARVIGVKNRSRITLAELREARPRRGERLLFRTTNSTRRLLEKPFTTDFVHFETDAARYLVERRVLVVGIDYLSVGGHRSVNPNGPEVHALLLDNDIFILEGLDLLKAPPGRYDMIALPLRIKDGDGSPARVILRSR